MTSDSKGNARRHRTKSTGRVAAGLLAAMLSLPLATATQAFLPTAAHAANDAPLIASLGDSYSSGEGNPPFYRRGLRVPPLQSRAVRRGSSGG